MADSDGSKVNRRRFLKSGTAAAVVGGVCFTSATLRDALAAAARSGRPLLTEKNLNAWVAEGDDKAYRANLAEASKDIKAAVEKRFYLTKAQTRELNSLPAHVTREIETSVVKMQQEKTRPVIHVSFGSYTECVRSEDPAEAAQGLGYLYTCSDTDGVRTCKASLTKKCLVPSSDVFAPLRPGKRS